MNENIKYNLYQIFWHKVFYKLNDLYFKTFGKRKAFIPPSLTPQETSNAIFSLLVSGKPCMIARYGATELYCLANYIGISQGWNAPGLICGKKEPWWWDNVRVSNMKNCSGFYPLTKSRLEKFCHLMLDDTRELDILGSWLEKENILSDLLVGVQKVFLPYMEPYYSSLPWTRVLAGKKVLVVHPFAELIEYQYKNHTKLFKDENILPQFDLQTIKAVQSLGGGDENVFSTWFEALDWMKSEIEKKEYDICLIGCGAYGFPLAAHVKRLGKQAIHMGGALQLLFGIKGNRWEDPMYGVEEWGIPKGFYTDMFNEYWRKPGENLRPHNADDVEGACYW